MADPQEDVKFDGVRHAHFSQTRKVQRLLKKH